MDFLLKGLLIGFSIAAPVGPIGVLCIRRTLAEGRSTGFVSGLGAATADAAYGAVAAFGLTAVSSFLLGMSAATRLLGGLFLCYLGLRTFLAAPPAQQTNGAPALASGGSMARLAGAYVSTFGLTITNPATILSFVAVFAGLGLTAGSGGDYVSAGGMVLGVFLGSAAWWLCLSLGVGLLRMRVGLGFLRWVNRASGVVLLLFGLAALAGLVA